VTRILVSAIGGFLLVWIGRVVKRRQMRAVFAGEASSNFESGDVRPLFERISRHVQAGFAESEIQAVEGLTRTLASDEERELLFPVRYRGKQALMRVVVFMDDIESPDIAVFTCKRLASEIQAEMTSFSNERGR